MTMVKVEEEPRAPVEGGCSVGGEEHRRVEIGGNGTVHGSIAGSVAGEGAEKPIHEARVVLLYRCIEVPSSEPDAPTTRPNQLTIFFGGKVRVFDGIPADKVCPLEHILILHVLSENLRLSFLIILNHFLTDSRNHPYCCCCC
ncbi:hypothetical protein DY000_02018310 [Brassica cretica]|uniref:Tify domain-containing protein n=1 Tax=Brassica cretica TaxID=69181 RepID=A0ABQ7CY70_BRACR|nr:hypothetical protein DY000_02018310 [Brassica cretica]